MNKNYQAQISDKLLHYLEETFHPEDSVLEEVRLRSFAAGLPKIQVGEMDGLHLAVLAASLQPRNIVEIGTLGGYSGIHLARSLLPGGKLYTFEYDPKHARVARESFEDAGLSSSVEVHLGAALENLPKIEKEGPFDLVFIDADKPNYPRYLSWAEKNIRVGGMIIGDNTFGWGMLTDTSFASEDDRLSIMGIRQFNESLAKNPAFKTTILPTGEGLTVAVRLK